MSDPRPPQHRLSPFDQDGQLWRELTPAEEAVPDLALALARNRSGPGDEYADRIPTATVTPEFDRTGRVEVVVRGVPLPVTALDPPATEEGSADDTYRPRDVEGDDGDGDA